MEFQAHALSDPAFFLTPDFWSRFFAVLVKPTPSRFRAYRIFWDRKTLGLVLEFFP